MPWPARAQPGYRLTLSSALRKLSALLSSALLSSDERTGCITATMPSEPTTLGNDSVTLNSR